MPLDLARWLPEFPVREHCLYMNHAAVAPLPRPVAEAMRRRIAEQETHGSREWERWRESEMAVRALTAQLTGARAQDIAMVRSTSEGLSLVAQGFPWRKGDAVLVGEEEFAANVAPWLALTSQGVKVLRYPTPGGRVSLDAVLPRLAPPVKVLALSWVAFHTGWVAPVGELAAAAHAAGVTVVLDAIQGLGALPDPFPALGVDALVADGHKWLLGPEGLGVLITTEALRHRLRPVLAGWRNVHRADRSLFLHELSLYADGRRFEPGSAPSILVAGLEAALDLLLQIGLDEVHERVVAHARIVTQALLEASWVVGSPGSAHEIAGIVAARHPFLPADEVVRRLAQRHIEVSARQRWVRFSPHFYATTGELEALRQILGKL
ncbi:MAG: aminotransferase class V-fold PLP-dependent enzyme [Acidobacteriota bacterium]